MKPSQELIGLLAEIERFGEENDLQHQDRSRRMLNITRDTGEFLSVLVRAMRAKRVLEIGTSNGYSTLWLAEAARTIKGRVTTVELSDGKIAMAAENFKRAGLSSVVTQVHGDAGSYLSDADDGAFDLIFLDSERSEYSRWWLDIRRVLRAGGLLVVDNAISHADEMALFVTLVEADVGFVTSLLPVGKGELLVTRA